MYKRKNGIYYTPIEFSSLIVKHLYQNISNKKLKNVLEPSCGDCRFIKAITQSFEINGTVYAVEKDKRAFDRLKKDTDLSNEFIKFVNQDFQNFSMENIEKFSLIAGNPPYVELKNLSVKFKKTLIGNKESSRYGRIRNLWQFFLNECVDMLDEDGVISMILPSEMLQVSYAEKLRTHLLTTFKYIEIITLGDGVFPELQQKVIVLNGYKRYEHEEGISFKKMSTDLEHLESPQVVETAFIKKENVGTKWINNRVTIDQYDLAIRVAQEVDGKISDYCVSSPGVVTGANNFFLRSKDGLKGDQKLKYHLPILQKGEFVKSCLDFTKADFFKNVEKGEKSYLLVLNDDKHAGSIIRAQLREAESQGISSRYKCSERTPWYNVGGIDVAEGFFFKRIYKYPKLIKNSSKVLTTDAAYKIKMKELYDIESFIFSFYNSLTLVQSEIFGRVYGGVLELTPSEFQSLKLPYLKISKDQFKKIDSLFRKTNDMNLVIDYVDNVVFKNLKIKKSDLKNLQNLRKSLVRDRI